MQTVLWLKSDYLRTGGPESLLRDLTNAIDQNRFSVVMGRIRRAGEAPTVSYPDVIRQIDIPWNGLAGTLATGRRAATIARQTGAAVLHSHDMRANAVSFVLRRSYSLPWIAHVHGWLGNTHRGRWRLYEAIDKRLICGADLVLVGSQAAAAEVRACGVQNVEVVPNAVAIPAADAGEASSALVRASLGLPGDALVFGMVGRLHPGKGQEVFLRAFADAARDMPNLYGLVVGEGEHKARLTALAAELGLSGRLHFVGYVQDIVPYVRAMDVVVVPSIKDSLPLTALEAMALSRPIIVSRAGDLQILVQNGVTGLVVPIGDPGAVAVQIRLLATDPALRQRLGAAARQRIVDAYSAEVMARRLEAHYARMVMTRKSNGN
jgi:glycosyltransferase involved in cell wall biosynthesis